jgi:hypothetical protein
VKKETKNKERFERNRKTKDGTKNVKIIVGKILR